MPAPTQTKIHRSISSIGPLLKPKFAFPAHLIIPDQNIIPVAATKTEHTQLSADPFHPGESEASQTPVDLGVTVGQQSLSIEHRLASATGVIEHLLLKVKDDCGAAFEQAAIEALALIQKHNPAAYRRIRAELKKSNKDMSITAVEDAMRTKAAEGNPAQTHHGYASDLIRSETVGEWCPVGHEGGLYVVDAAQSLWIRRPTEMIERMVAQAYDGRDNCERRSDYSGIAQHTITLAADGDFFQNAPVGLACPGGFYQVKDNAITVKPLSPAHRQRVKINVTPKAQETPIFNAFLHETFQSSILGEEEQQIFLVQEIAGAIMLVSRHEEVVG